jgi:allantoin racemase
VEQCIKAERDGFDAVAIASYNDPLLTESRSAVDIPVVSMAESSLLTACAVSRRFALITLMPESVLRLQELVARHSLEHRVGAILALEPRTNEAELVKAFDDHGKLLDSVRRAVERAVDTGCDLVIAAEGVLNEVFFAKGIHAVNGVPVLDCVGNVFLHAEMMVRLRARTGLSMGRRGALGKPDRGLFDAVRSAAGLE